VLGCRVRVSVKGQGRGSEWRVRVRGTDSGVIGQESQIRAIPRDRVQGQVRGERRDRGKVRTIYRTRVQVYGSRVG